MGSPGAQLAAFVLRDNQLPETAAEEGRGAGKADQIRHRGSRTAPAYGPQVRRHLWGKMEKGGRGAKGPPQFLLDGNPVPQTARQRLGRARPQDGAVSTRKRRRRPDRQTRDYVHPHESR